ncbi:MULTISPECIES: DNA-deoxyinosine glycosylase [Atopobium]|nr:MULTISPECIES: DNA-deoxyinosine glycosylase [Atopobium]ERL14145.1 DNA-deoxyinosine glycosylase [Atopobium sp. BV3Ac4]KRN55187.1 T U mismatch-specific DNA glycosylase [Atopobium minutum]MBS4872857.1 DNA-deoxyinosine glycosylase [Atopobium minutum]MDU5129640.1 DNA-deoxyinosine glycosylase [Atopobium minutum]MDU5356954.1 DNA-deoxyinosine glycosylase [Atopobium minutum]
MESKHESEHVQSFEPLMDAHCRVLVLGTVPSPKSREVHMNYGNPRNRFWLVMARLFNEPLPSSNEQKAALVLRHHIALWDVLESCDIVGASDASIVHPVPNNLSRVLDVAPIHTIFCTGATAARLYKTYCEPVCGLTAVALPSTSPANARWSLDDLVEAYTVIKLAVQSHPSQAGEARG